LCEQYFISSESSFLTSRFSTKHSSYSSSFPIYLFNQKTEEIPDPDAVEEEPEVKADEDLTEEKDEDEAIVEDATDEKKEEEEKKPKMKTITVDEWLQLNAQPPLWTRDPKSVTDGRLTSL
jgi:heat shock protein 90kDa beta